MPAFPHHPRPAAAVLCVATCLALTAGSLAGASWPEGECAPPRTRIVIGPLVDATDGSWTAWSGVPPAALVRRLLADSLMSRHGRDVVLVDHAAGPRARSLEDARALELGRRARAEVVVCGVVSLFRNDDRREPGKLSRWGGGAPDAKSSAEVRVTLRVLDTSDGSVVLEATVARERRRRGTASAGRPGAGPADTSDAPGGPLAEALGEVISDLARSLDQRLLDRWQANVVGATRELCVLDAGMANGLFRGERLEVWRPGIETWDEELNPVGEQVRVGIVVVTELQGSGRARARLLEGDVRPGDLVRPCLGGAASPFTLRR